MTTETHSGSRATAAASRNRLVLGGPSLRARARRRTSRARPCCCTSSCPPWPTRTALSFYGDGTLAALLRMTLPALIQARDELLAAI